MNLLIKFIDFFLHLDKYLGSVVLSYGSLTYGLLFLIIFCETGLVVTPILPGDSLLFAAGSFAALGSLNIFYLLAILGLAAILGDTANYWIGHFLGQKLIESNNRFIKREYLERSQKFYEKHGVKTIVIARFVPIVRTFAPFLAGVGKMRYGRFLAYNVIGGLAWVGLFLLGGYFFGQLPAVKRNFSLVIFAIIILSLLPIAIEYYKRSKTD